MKKIMRIVLSLCACLSALTGCKRREKQKYSTIIFGFDTVISLVSYQESQEEFDRMAAYVKERYDYFNSLYDIYNDYDGINNLKTVNDNAGIGPVQVSREIIDLLEFSKEWYEKSGGKLNVAMGSVLRVWHDVREEFSATGTATLPDMDLLRQKAEHTDINRVQIDRENMTVYITDSNVQLDVGAVAKGYATEMICDELREKYDNFAISAGGNVKTHGHPRDGRERWGIGIENPMVDENFDKVGGNLDTAYFNTDMSLVCSGGYERFFVLDGKRYHHVIDPVTLYPEEVYRGVSIFYEDSGVADALSTTTFLSTPQQAMELVESIDGAECILVEIDGTVHKSSGVDAYLASAGVDSMTK